MLKTQSIGAAQISSVLISAASAALSAATISFDADVNPSNRKISMSTPHCAPTRGKRWTRDRKCLDPIHRFFTDGVAIGEKGTKPTQNRL